MVRKSLVGALVVLLVVGLVIYWRQGRDDAAGPAIAGLPPAQALAFIAAPGWSRAWDDLRRTQYFQQVSSPAYWQAMLGMEGYQHLMESKQHLEQQLGVPITEQTVDQWLNREVAVALVPRQQGGWPLDVIAYLRVSATEKIAESLARLWPSMPKDLARDTQTVDGIDIITLRHKDLPSGVSYALLGNLAVVSTDAIWVGDAIKAVHGMAPARLQTIPLVRDMRVEHSESWLAYGYYDAEGLQAQLMTAISSAVPAPPSEVLQMLQTTNKMSLKALRSDAGITLETMALYPSGATPQAFRRTEGDSATPPFRGVPAETFYLTHVDLLDLQGLWQLIRQVAALGPPAALEQWLAQFRAETGVDLERDVLPVFTGVVGLGFTTPLGAQANHPVALPGLFLTFGVTEETRARQLIQTVGDNVGGPLFTHFLERRPHAGQEISYVANPLLFIKPGYVVSQHQLIVASDVSLLQQMLDAASGQTPALADTKTFQEMRQHIRLNGGSVTFIDMPMILSRVREWWARISMLAQALARREPGEAPSGLRPADPWMLLDLLRPIRYLGAISQGEARGIRTEAFIALQDRR
jgi:hypothetical protein